MAGVFSFLKKKSASSVKFYLNNVASNWWPDFSGNSDTSYSGIAKTAEELPDVYAITDYISQIVANIPVKFETRAGKESKNDQLRRLVAEPNYYQNWNELIKQFTAWYEILGNSYLYGIKPEGMNILSGLHVLPAGYVSIVLLMDKDLPDWINEVALYKVSIANKDYKLLPESVLHKRNFSLRYDSGAYIYGVSKYIPGNKITTELKAIYDAKTSIISQRGALGILSNESEIPDVEESKEIKKKLQEKFGLATSQDKFIVTTQKLSWQQMSMGLAELQIIENAKYSFAKLCYLNNIDPVIFSTEGSTFANKAEAEKAMMKKVIKPKVDDLYNDLNTWLRPYFGGDMIVPDWSQVEELQADMGKLTDMYVKHIECGLITPYKAALKIYGQVDESNPPKDEYFRKTALSQVPQENAGTGLTPMAGEVASVANVANQGLNGAQITGLIQILEQIAAGLINEESASAIISASFPYMSPDLISSIVRGVGNVSEVSRLVAMVNGDDNQNDDEDGN